MRKGEEGGGKEGRREGGKEGRREGGKEGRREGGKEGRREGGRKGRNLEVESSIVIEGDNKVKRKRGNHPRKPPHKKTTREQE